MSWLTKEFDNDWVKLRNGFRVRKSRIDAFVHDFTGESSTVYMASGAKIDMHESPEELEKILGGEGPGWKCVSSRWEVCSKCGGSGKDGATCVVCKGSGKVYVRRHKWDEENS